MKKTDEALNKEIENLIATAAAEGLSPGEYLRREAQKLAKKK